MDGIIALLEPLHKNGIYPLVLIFCLGAYFTVRYWLDKGPKKSQYVPLISGFIGMLYYIFPTDVDSARRYFVLSLFQGVLAIGFYSFAEKRGWVDGIGAIIEQRLGIGRKASAPQDQEPKP